MVYWVGGLCGERWSKEGGGKMVVGIGVETGLGVLRLQVSGEEDEVVGRVDWRGCFF